MHKFFLGILAGCFFVIFHLLPGSLAAQEICPFPTTSGEVTYQEDWQLQWAPDNPQEIAQNQSVTLHVINGAAPYTWSVAESGFSLAATDNAGDANTLFADNSACGSATITVTDSAGDSVIGHVRGTTGRWVAVNNPPYINIPESVPIEGGGWGGYPSCIGHRSKTYGKYSVTEYYRTSCGQGSYGGAPCATRGYSYNYPDHHWPTYLFATADDFCKYMSTTYYSASCPTCTHCCENGSSSFCWIVYNLSVSEWGCN